MSVRLEQRYRRLMLSYPAAYRRTFGDEMLGVAMSGAAPGQSRPTVREAADLIGSGLRRRLGSAGQAIAQPQWRPGLAFVNAGLIVLNAAASIHWVVGMLPQKRILGLVVCAAAWVLAFVATAARWRRTAALAAIVGFGVNALLLTRDAHRGLLDGVLTAALIGLAPYAAAVITGVALALGPALPARRFRTALYLLICGAGMLVVTELGDSFGATPALTIAVSVTVAVAFVALLRHRNRAVSRTALIVATYLSVVVVSQRAYDHLYPASTLSVAVRLTSVAVVPVVVFVLGALLIRRHERRVVRSLTDVTATGAV